MSIRMKLANWLVKGEIDELQLYISRLERAGGDCLAEISKLKSELYLERGHTNSLRASLTKIYNIPCKPNSNGSLQRAHKIAAHALWKE